MSKIKKKLVFLMVLCLAFTLVAPVFSSNVHAEEKWETAYTKKFKKVKKKASSAKSHQLKMDNSDIPVMVVRTKSGSQYKLTFYKYNGKKVKSIGSYKIKTSGKVFKTKTALGHVYENGHDDYVTIFKISGGKVKQTKYRANYHGTIFAKYFKGEKVIAASEYEKVIANQKKVKFK